MKTDSLFDANANQRNCIVERDLITILDYTSSIVMAINDDGIVCFVNKFALKFFDKKKEEVLGKQFGEFLSCAEIINEALMCGKGPLCHGCVIRKKASDALAKDEVTEDVIFDKILTINGKLIDYWFRISVAPVMMRGQRLALLTLSDYLDSDFKSIKKSLENTTKPVHNLPIHVRDNLLNQLPVMVWSVNAKFECTYVNKEWIEFTGISYDAALGRVKMEIIHPDDRHTFNKVIYENRYSRSMFNVEARLRRLDGEYRWLLFTWSPFYNIEKEFEGYIGTLVDITQRKLISEQIKEQEELFRTVYEKSPMGITLCSIDGDIYDVNPMFERITARSKSELTHLGWKGIIHPEDGDINSISRGVTVKKRLITPENETVWANITSSQIDMGSRFGYINICMVENITDQVLAEREAKEKEAKIRYMNFHDMLTGLYNRAHFEIERKHIDTADNYPLSIIVLDVNGLARINKEADPLKGDQLILSVAQKLRRCCRLEDVICRMGGDEFSVLLPRTAAHQADELMKRLEEEFQEYNCENWFYSTVSLGRGTKVDVTENFNNVIDDAEKNMYLHKLLQDKSLRSTVFSSMKTTLFEKSKETREHAERLVFLSRTLASEAGLSGENMDKLELLSNLHDIGKIGISDLILNKPGSLSADEWELMRKHSEIGYRIAMSTPDLEPIADIILYHHERYDGAGYPKGLKGDEIPMLARIIAIVDSFDAMTHDRVYRNALTREEAVKEIRLNAGTQFDPVLAELFVDKVLKKLDERVFLNASDY